MRLTKLNAFVASARNCSVDRPAEPDVAEEAEVDVAVAGAVDDAAAGGAVRADRRLRRRPRVLNHCSISSSRGRPLIELGVADEVGAIGGQAVEVAIQPRR